MKKKYDDRKRRLSAFLGKIGSEECPFSSAQFQTPHRTKGSRGRYGLCQGVPFPKQKSGRKRIRRRRKKEGEEERKREGAWWNSGAQSVEVSRLPSVLSLTGSVQASTASLFNSYLLSVRVLPSETSLWNTNLVFHFCVPNTILQGP